MNQTFGTIHADYPIDLTAMLQPIHGIYIRIACPLQMRNSRLFGVRFFHLDILHISG
ncbi:MAG: hypothetical protein ACLQVD_04950 [Capsulimonadaceae bacterium]